jgi:hypothetical protein
VQSNIALLRTGREHNAISIAIVVGPPQSSTLGDKHPVFALKLIVRSVLSLVLGWFLLLVPMAIGGLFGMHGWGFMHSGLALLSLPFTIGVAFWAFGYLPVLRLSARDRASPSQPPPVA